METIKDYFGNEIKVGDNIIFALSKHSSLAIGEVISIGKSGNYVMAKIIIAPFGGYWKTAKEQIGEEVKVALTKNVEENTCHWEMAEGQADWEHPKNRYFDYYNTNYVYAMKFFGEIPNNTQYKFDRSELTL